MRKQGEMRREIGGRGLQSLDRLGLGFIRRECSGLSPELKHAGAGEGWWFGESGGCSLERVGVGRPRGWTGQSLGEGAVRLNECSTSAPWALPGAPVSAGVPTTPGPLLGPMALQLESQGQPAESQRRALQGPRGLGRAAPLGAPAWPLEGATRRLAPTRHRHRILQATFFPPP